MERHLSVFLLQNLGSSFTLSSVHVFMTVFPGSYTLLPWQKASCDWLPSCTAFSHPRQFAIGLTLVMHLLTPECHHRLFKVHTYIFPLEYICIYFFLLSIQLQICYTPSWPISSPKKYDLKRTVFFCWLKPKKNSLCTFWTWKLWFRRNGSE